MDRATRIYALILAAFVLGLAVLFLYEDPKVSDLNDRLEADETVAGFTYPFRVVGFNNGIATLSTPRSTEVPVERVLGILFPGAKVSDPGSESFRSAQQELAWVQKRAVELVQADPEVNSVRWRLDRPWLNSHGIQVAP